MRPSNHDTSGRRPVPRFISQRRVQCLSDLTGSERGCPRFRDSPDIERRSALEIVQPSEHERDIQYSDERIEALISFLGPAS